MGERGDLRVNLSGNQSGFQAMLSNATHTAKKFSQEVTHSWGSGLVAGGVGGFLGMFSFEAIKSSFEGFINRAASLRQLSEQMEMGADATQKWAKAADQLGIEFGTIQNVLMAIQQKRVEALTDPKTADLFKQLGFSREDVIDVEGKDIRQQVLQAGMKSPENRNIVMELAGGRRGAKAFPAANVFDHVSADMSADALDTAHRAELAKKSIGYYFDRFIANILGGRGAANVPNPNLYPGFSLGQSQHPTPPPAAKTLQLGAPAYGADIHAAVKDPLQSLLAEHEADRQNAIDAAEESQRAAERKNMTPFAGRIGLKQEWLRTRKKIEEEEMRHMPDTLKTDKEKKDWEAKHEERLAGLRGKLAGYQYDLRLKPLSMGADALARSGLFGASALNTVNGSDNVAKQQLMTLRSIDRKLGPRKDPAKI